MFPSPTGVTYYDLDELMDMKEEYWCFRPQQGLPIMNDWMRFQSLDGVLFGFRPQQGLPIMNWRKRLTSTWKDME